ncbi:MAG TPA: dihydrofolate reductase [Candidatus Paceibacterota bacterium]
MMTKPKINIVVAVTSTHLAIGNKGKLMVHIGDDLKRFKALTLGHPVILGRKTYESIGKSLPGRTNIVITRNPDFKAEECIVVGSLTEAIERAGTLDSEVFVIGGGEIYREALPLTDKLYLTLVKSDATGDVVFPDWRDTFTKETYREERVDEKTGLHYSWIDLER